MSKNTNLSFLTDFLTADIVNSRVGMNNVSPQSTFDVTGTGKFSGILTLGSTVSNGTYTYTLPSATGTLALTSDIPVVTGYVPYTGATTSVDLGNNVLTSRGLNIDSIGGTAGALNLRQATSFSTWSGAPFTSIYATTGNRVVFSFSNDNRSFTLDGSLVSAASPRTFTFPDATGTFALTSQIPANAVGGTGTLNTIPKFTAATTIGNSNIFDSGSIIYNTNPAAGTFAWQFNGSTVTGQSYGAQVVAGTNASDIGFKVMNAAASINYLVVRGDGLVTLTGALNGTSAAFTNAISNDFSIGGTFAASFSNSNSTGYGLYVRGGSNVREAILIADNAGNQNIKLYGDGSATFSSSVTANGDVFINNASNAQIGFNTTGALNSVGAYLYFNRSSVNKWTAGMGPYTGSNNFEIVTGSVVALSLAVTTGAATFTGDLIINSLNPITYCNATSNNRASGIVTQESGTSKWAFGTNFGTSDNSWNVYNYTAGARYLTIASTGAATFSSSVTASGTGTFGSTNYLTNISTGSGATYQRILNTGGDVIFGINNSTGGSLLPGAAGYATVLYNNTNTDISFGTNQLERMRITSDGYVWINGSISGMSGSSANLQINGFARIGNQIILHNSANAAQSVSISCNGADSFNIAGALSKNSGSFRIDHPLLSKKDTHHLVHSFIEGPQADNIYRGKIQLVNGKAIINLDQASKMTEGTFVLLNGNVQCFTSNESGWTSIKGRIDSNILIIESEDSECTDTVSWLVVGERHDQHMIDTDWTDENGKVIVEPLKK
jgi:hypothetical protein